MRDAGRALAGLAALCLLAACSSKGVQRQHNCGPIACVNIYEDSGGGATVSDTWRVYVTSATGRGEQLIAEVSNPDGLHSRWMDNTRVALWVDGGTIDSFRDSWTDYGNSSGKIGGDVRVQLDRKSYP